MLTFFLIGFAAGAVTGIPIGPVNVAVIDAAYRHTLRRAIAVGVGGSIADFIYVALGVMGITPMIRKYPNVELALFGFSGLVLIAYGLLTARSRPITPAAADAAKSPNPSKEMWSGFTVGLALILLNPAALVAWISIINMIEVVRVANTNQGLMFGFGVLIGSFAWFALVGYLTHRGKHLLGEKAVWIPRIIGIVLMGYGCYLLAKTALRIW